MNYEKIRWVVRLHEGKMDNRGKSYVGRIRSEEPLTDEEKDLINNVLLEIERRRTDMRLKLGGIK